MTLNWSTLHSMRWAPLYSTALPNVPIVWPMPWPYTLRVSPVKLPALHGAQAGLDPISVFISAKFSAFYRCGWGEVREVHRWGVPTGGGMEATTRELPLYPIHPCIWKKNKTLHKTQNQNTQSLIFMLDYCTLFTWSLLLILLLDLSLSYLVETG